MIVIQALFSFSSNGLFKEIKTRWLHAQLVWFNIDAESIYEISERCTKNPGWWPNFATLLVICMGVLLLYVWFNFDDLRSEQAYRQMWYLKP